MPEEVNLRFYVRYKEDQKWKRGVVFMKELVPKRMISFVAKSCSGAYEVKHPSWNVHKVRSFSIKCNATLLYGDQFTSTLQQEPLSVFLAEGSAIQVMKKKTIFK